MYNVILISLKNFYPFFVNPIIWFCEMYENGKPCIEYGKIYIKNEEHGIFITMEGGEVTITNHTYSYFIKLNNEKWIKLEKYFLKSAKKTQNKYTNPYRKTP